MAKILKSPRARADLADIWRASYERWGADQADKYIEETGRAIEALADYPELGADCGWIRDNYRRLTIHRHAVYYIIDGAKVEIIRVLHDRMDAKARLR